MCKIFMKFENKDNINPIEWIKQDLDKFHEERLKLMKAPKYDTEKIEYFLMLTKRSLGLLRKEVDKLKRMELRWNRGLERVKKADKVAEENPELFEKYIEEYNYLCNEMSSVMEWYKVMTGKDIPETAFEDGFKEVIEFAEDIYNKYSCEAIENSTEGIQEGAQHE